MSKQSNILLSVIALPLCLIGCAHQSSTESVGGNFSDPDQLTSAWASSAPRVSGTTTATAPGGGLATLTITNTASSAPADPADKELLDKVQGLLMADRTLVPHPSQVTVSLDPNEKGTVVLSGKVKNGLIKQAVTERVAQLPGVTRVDDQIEVGLPDDPGTAKAGDIVPEK